eukprot:TRINITY_DN37205_c0_g1_i1.p1 TRINITY_DN37205_c0_g1~~TRINITY_DN37205_c0_g1_i1.p1  ORF type:complete len:478 (+),score=77.48 TRINITY_DN37205_c0_g1_i1:83-1435(+)
MSPDDVLSFAAIGVGLRGLAALWGDATGYFHRDEGDDSVGGHARLLHADDLVGREREESWLGPFEFALGVFVGVGSVLLAVSTLRATPMHSSTNDASPLQQAPPTSGIRRPARLSQRLVFDGVMPLVLRPLVCCAGAWLVSAWPLSVEDVSMWCLVLFVVEVAFAKRRGGQFPCQVFGRMWVVCRPTDLGDDEDEPMAFSTLALREFVKVPLAPVSAALLLSGRRPLHDLFLETTVEIRGDATQDHASGGVASPVVVSGIRHASFKQRLLCDVVLLWSVRIWAGLTLGTVAWLVLLLRLGATEAWLEVGPLVQLGDVLRSNEPLSAAWDNLLAGGGFELKHLHVMSPFGAALLGASCCVLAEVAYGWKFGGAQPLQDFFGLVTVHTDDRVGQRPDLALVLFRELLKPFTVPLFAITWCCNQRATPLHDLAVDTTVVMKDRAPQSDTTRVS